MKTTLRTAVLLLLVMILAAVPCTAWASSMGAGILLGNDSTVNGHAWTFSLINLTSSNVQIGAKGSTEGHDFGHNFPYGVIFPPGNSANSKSTGGVSATPTLNLTTWSSNDNSHMFDYGCPTTVSFEIVNDPAYNFSLVFRNDKDYTRVTPQPPYKATSWKYNTDVANDNGYYARTAYSTGDGGEGYLAAISDKYVVAVFKNNQIGLGGNDLILVITERNPIYDYHGHGGDAPNNQIRWVF